MAEVLHPPKVESLSKHVQEMSIDGDEPPPRYIVKDRSIGPTNSSVASVPIPIIDLSLLSSSSSFPSKEEEELEKLRLALSSWGCFQVIGHGISSSFLDNVRDVTKQFFALPVEEKRKYSRAVDDFEGYGNDPVLSEKQVLDWSDRLFLKLLPEDQRKLKLWPEKPNDFREILNEYSLKMKSIIDLLFKAMEKSLNLEENSFSNQFGDEACMHARFNFYPVCPKPNQVLGVKAHSDGSGITILLQDKEVEGLQMLKDDQWIRVPIIPHALVVNAGDQLQIMSNGIFKSPLHRVAANSESERMSLAVFYVPDDEKEIEPAAGLIDEKRPQLYKKLKNYVAINFQCFQSGTISTRYRQTLNSHHPHLLWFFPINGSGIL